MVRPPFGFLEVPESTQVRFGSEPRLRLVRTVSYVNRREWPLWVGSGHWSTTVRSQERTVTLDGSGPKGSSPLLAAQGWVLFEFYNSLFQELKIVILDFHI